MKKNTNTLNYTIKYENSGVRYLKLGFTIKGNISKKISVIETGPLGNSANVVLICGKVGATEENANQKAPR